MRAKRSLSRAVEIATLKTEQHEGTEGDKETEISNENENKKESLFSNELIEIPITNDSLSPETVLLLAENGALNVEEKRKYLLINAGLTELI